jgi:hypothetical protein
MNWTLKKLWPSGGLLLIASMIQLHADSSSAKNGTAKSSQQDACSTPCFSPIVSVEALYLTAREDGLVYAETDNLPSSIPLADLVNADFVPSRHAREKQVNFGWDWGVRVGFGGLLPRHDNWSLMLEWTNYRQHNHQSVRQNDKKVIFTTWVSPRTFMSFAQQAGSKWVLHYNTLDLPLGRTFMPSRTLCLKPHFGLRAAWIRQGYTIEYKGLTGNPRDVVLVDEAKIKLKNHFHGAGLRAGLDSKWEFAKHWNIYGNFAAALLYGRFEVTDKEHSEGIGPLDAFANQLALPPVVPNADIEDHIRSTAINLDLGAGIVWDLPFSNDRRMFSINLGYEYHLWLDQNKLEQFSNAGETGTFHQDGGDLSLTGVVLGLRCQF